MWPSPEAPSKERAQQAYRSAWADYLLCRNPNKRKHLEETMDFFQQFCTESGSPGPEWEAFTDTLPGFKEFFASQKEEIRRMIKGAKRREKGK